MIESGADMGGKTNTKVQWTPLMQRSTVGIVVSGPASKERNAIERSLISIVDDDESVRESLPDLLGEFGFTARVFSSGEEFLLSDCVAQTRCLILDVVMPGMSGLDLQRELKHIGQEIPIIFITAQRDEALRPRVIKQGAVDCLFKPFSDTALHEAIRAALRNK